MATSLSCGGPIVVDVREVGWRGQLTTKLKHDYTAKDHPRLPCLGRQAIRAATHTTTPGNSTRPNSKCPLFLSVSS